MAMKVKNEVVSLILVAAMGLATCGAESLAGCPGTCGNVSIPYPFGVGDKCSLHESFNLTCEENSKLLYGNILVLNISLEGHMRISMFVARICHDESGARVAKNSPSLTTAAFTISSTANKFVTVGCDAYGYLNTFQNSHTYSTGCLTRCDTLPPANDNGTSCSGIGCCQVDIPLGMRNISFQAYSFNNHSGVFNFSNCTYAFVAENGTFDFSMDYLTYLPFNMSPMVVDWYVPNGNCSTSPQLACAINSHCQDSHDGLGYSCTCNSGYHGNPYHPHGCDDTDECSADSLHNCLSKEHCRNTNGSFYCQCPPHNSGNGTKEGGCQPPLKDNPLIKILVGVCGGLVALFVGVPWVYLVYQKRKLMKSKEKFFRQNGGFILRQRLSAEQGSSLQTATIFTAEELKKATNNFDDSLIIGRGGFGTVYKGRLTDNTIVAIKKSKVVDQSQKEQFINEVVVLSQINHRNVVKLLGCCLETEVPLLVYEFVNNGTVFDYIHSKSKSSNHESRLKIAEEAAEALSYLHSAACIPIIHRDVKTSNILLDENYTAKVSDFGASRLVPLDQNEVATIVQGTLGYLDPEYMQTHQLTEKSDVYSFGVVLVELLTGKKPLSFDGPQEERNLPMHFLSSLKKGELFQVVQVGILNNENKQMLQEVAQLAARCLRLRGEERPSMKEVAMEIQGIRIMGTHSRVQNDDVINFEETRSLLGNGDTSGLSECGHRSTGWDNSITHHVLINLDDGR